MHWAAAAHTETRDPGEVSPYFLDVGQVPLVHLDLPPWSVASVVIH